MTGEWWRVEVDFEPDIMSDQATLVMAGDRGDAWLFGMAQDAFSDLVAQFHFPPVGPVDKRMLGYEVHEEHLHLLDFPLEEGKSWTTPFAGQTCTVTVLSTSGDQAHLEMGGLCTWHALVTYDAQAGLPTSVVVDNYGSYRMLDHGFGHVGPVIVPDEHVMEIFEARIGGLLHPVGPEPRAPIVTVELPDAGYTHVSLLMLAGAFFVPATPGEFQATVTLPNGTVHLVSRSPLDGIGTTMIIPRIPAAPGPWAIELVAVGGGAAIVEGFAWKELVIQVG